ncbi:MAG: 4-phosphopantetheinyl transferase family protein [Microscillaceae bacterium]|nr:4-phosphopantetheinyl transferase family protein [Microscillaceae bacterium]
MRYQEELAAGGAWGLWHTEETEAEMQQAFYWPGADKQGLALVGHPVKRREYLSARLALQALLALRGRKYTGLQKDAYAKPHLLGATYHISISHAFPFATAILHPQCPVGIDIEPVRPKIQRIAPRFLAPEELEYASDSLPALTILWAAKEALYKLYGQKELIFRENMRVQPFVPQEKGQLSAQLLLLPDEVRNYEVVYRQWHNFFIAYVY